MTTSELMRSSCVPEAEYGIAHVNPRQIARRLSVLVVLTMPAIHAITYIH